MTYNYVLLLRGLRQGFEKYNKLVAVWIIIIILLLLLR
jgi:hypothetical protein